MVIPHKGGGVFGPPKRNNQPQKDDYLSDMFQALSDEMMEIGELMAYIIALPSLTVLMRRLIHVAFSLSESRNRTAQSAANIAKFLANRFLK